MTDRTDLATNPDYGRCTVCGGSFQIKRDGNLRHHLAPKTSHYKPPTCKGAGRAPFTSKES